MSGAFANYALEYFERDVATIPSAATTASAH